MKRLMPFALLLFGVGMLVLGVLDGQFAQTAAKASLICLECIGIG